MPMVLNMILSSMVSRPLGSSVTIVLRVVGSAFQSYSATILNTAITLSHAKYDLGLNGEPSLGQPVGGAVRAAPVQAEWETVARSIGTSPFAGKPSHWEVAALAGEFSPRIEQVFGDGKE